MPPGTLRRLGEGVSEVLEYVPARFNVIRTVRPKLSCACCSRIVQELGLQRVGCKEARFSEGRIIVEGQFCWVCLRSLDVTPL